MAQKKKINGNMGMGVRMLRQRSGMTLRALAKRAGVTPGMISCVENGKASPSMVTLEKILIALNTSFSAFFGATQKLRTGDAFYIKQGVSHRGYATGREQARLITVMMGSESVNSRREAAGGRQLAMIQ